MSEWRCPVCGVLCTKEKKFQRFYGIYVNYDDIWLKVGMVKEGKDVDETIDCLVVLTQEEIIRLRDLINRALETRVRKREIIEIREEEKRDEE